MGTPAYMAPEQVEGREPSSAADLFSLGLVLYEMAVGKLPFPGASLGQMLSSGSQTSVPQPSRERVGVPASLDPLVARLLEKDPAKRPQSASEVARELSTLADRLAAPPRSRVRFLYAIPAALLLLGIAVALYLHSKASDSQPPIPSNPASYTQLTSFTDAATGPVLSPDGRLLAFYRTSSLFGTTSDIWLKLLPNGEPVQITHDSHLEVRHFVLSRRRSHCLHHLPQCLPPFSDLRRPFARWRFGTVPAKLGGIELAGRRTFAVLPNQVGDPHGSRNLEDRPIRPARDLFPRA